MARSLRFYGDRISFRVVFGQSFSFRVFPGGVSITQPRWMLARGILGSGRTRGVSFRPFLNSSGWWWLISSIFLIRISCHKTTHANGYYGAWPGWVVSISVLPLTLFLCVCISALLLSQLNKLSLYVLSCLFCSVSNNKLCTCTDSFCLRDKCIFH